jgi:hypothetical protein
VRARLGLACKESSAFEHDINIMRAPGNFGGVANREHFDLVALDHQMVAVDRDLLRERAVRGVVARQMCVRFRITEVIDRNDFDVGATGFVQRTQDISANATVAVDANFNSHIRLS